MTPPIWRDAQGRPLPTRPCRTCGRPTPIRRARRLYPGELRANGWEIADVALTVQWCGHATESITWPGAGTVRVVGADHRDCAATGLSVADHDAVYYR